MLYYNRGDDRRAVGGGTITNIEERRAIFF